MDFNEFSNMSLGQMVKETKRKQSAYIDCFLQCHLDHPLHSCEGATLCYIYSKQGEALYASDIMKRFSISKATTSQTLHQLQEKGLIEFTNEKNKRCKEIILTQKGIDTNLALDSCFEKINQAFENGITPEEKEEFTRILFKLYTNAQLLKGDESL